MVIIFQFYVMLIKCKHFNLKVRYILNVWFSHVKNWFDLLSCFTDTRYSLYFCINFVYMWLQQSISSVIYQSFSVNILFSDFSL